MRILHNDHIFLIVLDDLVIFIADRSCAELNKMSEVGVVVKYLPDSFGTPHMPCSARIRLAEFCIVVVRGNRHTVFVELISNVMRRYSACSHFKDVADDRCCIWIDHRQMIRIIAFRVTERSAGRAILASLCICFDDRFDLLGSTNICTNLIAYDNYGSWYAISYTGTEHLHHHHVTKQVNFTYDEFNYEQFKKDTEAYFGTVYLPKTTYEVEFAALKNDKLYADFLDFLRQTFLLLNYMKLVPLWE